MANQDFPPIVDSAGVSTSAASPAPASDKEKNEEAFGNLPGFIFLCSGETKVDCFKFRVFGLRANKMKIAEKIKPGAKLFLFDVELKLLYGVYEATSTGKVDLEPCAFGGKFRAQVQFRIYKECLPLQEASFRHALKGNYRGRKFEPELNGRQVTDLLSLFSPLAAPTITTVVPEEITPNSNPPFAKEHQDESERQPPLPPSYVDERNTGDDVESDSSEDTDSSEDSQDESDQQDVLSGFIFLCGRNTKHDCYRFRVFGLPSHKRETIEKIKPGTKLFLFDFELKLLYGVYEATSTGILGLEPLAFGGKFPAQVKFRIFKECLPLSETSFRNAIKDNYRGGKFEPELNDQQVKTLLCLFHPLAASATTAAVPRPLLKANHSLANAGMPNTVPAVNMGHQGKYPPMPTSAEDPYMIRMQHVHPPPIMESEPAYELQSAHHGWNRTTNYMSYPQTTLGSSVTNVPPSNTIPTFNMGHQGQYPPVPISAEDPYMTRVQHVHPPPIMESQPPYELQNGQHGWPRTTNLVDNAHPVVEHQTWNAPSHAYSHQQYATEGISQDPYFRYRAMQDDRVRSQQHVPGPNYGNYQMYSQAERHMLPPQESTVTPNYYYSPSAPFVPQIQQQHSSQTVIQEGTSSTSIRKFVCTETRMNY